MAVIKSQDKIKISRKKILKAKQLWIMPITFFEIENSYIFL